MREVRLRQRAQLDLESLYIYIAYESAMPKAAESTLEALYGAFERLADLPESGMLFASDDLDREYRRTLVKNYWVYYTYDDDALTLWRIFHVRQDIDTCTVVNL